MKKNLLMLGFLIATSLTNHLCLAQVTYYKIENGQKTPVKQGEPVTIELNGKQDFKTNLLMEIDLAAFRKKHNYDNIMARLKYSNSDYTLLHSAKMTFDDPATKKKYTGVKTLQVYMFECAESSKDPKSLVLFNAEEIKTGDAENTYSFDLSGSYVTGKEEYYDERSRSWKQSEIYSEYEPIKSLPGVTFKLSETFWTNFYYDNFIHTGLSKQFNINNKKFSSLSIIELNLNLDATNTGSPEVKNAITNVLTAKREQIRKETDRKKSVELYIAWHDEAQYLRMNAMDKKTLKAFVKELSVLTTPDEILALFKKYNSSPKTSWSCSSC